MTTDKTRTALPRQKLAEKVYDMLREQIMDHEFAEDNRLNIDALSIELNVSQTPIREALSRLAAEGLIDFTSYKGYTVRLPLSPRELDDFLHVRKLLEVDAVRIAATRITLFDLNALSRILQHMQDLRPSPKFRDYRVFNQFDQQFHGAIVALAGNTFLTHTYESLNVHLHLARYYRARRTNDLTNTIDEHQAIYEALKQHDIEGAVIAVEAHINNAYLRAINLDK
jgi:DNA-binding GntR family transcriptional regulator